jgi:hypothetical protein
MVWGCSCFLLYGFPVLRWHQHTFFNALFEPSLARSQGWLLHNHTHALVGGIAIIEKERW